MSVGDSGPCGSGDPGVMSADSPSSRIPGGGALTPAPPCDLALGRWAPSEFCPSHCPVSTLTRALAHPSLGPLFGMFLWATYLDLPNLELRCGALIS